MLPREVRTQQVQLLGARRVSGRAGVKLTPPTPTRAQMDFLGSTSAWVPRAKMFSLRWERQLGFEEKLLAFEFQWVCRNQKLTLVRRPVGPGMGSLETACIKMIMVVESCNGCDWGW